MKITYLYHSGFLVETTACTYIFDYYRGALPELDAGKPVLALSSHSHSDHYNPEIFKLLDARPGLRVTAVLSDDIPMVSMPGNVPCVRLGPGENHTFPWGIRIETLRSTDEGVAFLITEPEGVLYHAGDLNDWVWSGESDAYNREMTLSYRREIDKLRGIPVDVAFLPLDPRQEADYDRGILYFLQNVQVKRVYPMHYWKKPQIITQFLKDHPKYEDVVQLTEG